MAKAKTVFFCKNCGAESAKWNGKCFACGEWNTLVEEVVSKGPEKSWKKSDNPLERISKVYKINEVKQEENNRIICEDEELNRVLGGGFVNGSVVLIGGEPGIGKSTLLLQLALSLRQRKILYVTGEESLSQIKLRSERIKHKNDECYVLAETNTQRIFQLAAELTPDLLIIDSIQTVHTDYLDAGPGSISQIKECAAEFQRFAKESGATVILVGHITKDGSIAGPKLLEHIVDVVLQFEGDSNHIYRILRASKNRFGSTAEIGIYEMNEEGLRMVSNPSELLLSERDSNLSGIAISAALEGQRAFMIEIQALVANAIYGTAQRSSTGFDLRRMHMLLAVIEKRSGFKMANKDVFLNLAGGLKITDPALDLAVAAAIMSSYEDMAVKHNYAFAAELGLSGEIRAVSHLETRIKEAERLGFEKIFIAAAGKKFIKQQNFKIEICYLTKVYELLPKLFK